MNRADKTLEEMRKNPQNVSFDAAVKVCEEYFGEPRRRGGSHVVFKMPWPGDPRVNLQKGKNGMAKTYQVRQAIDAIDKVQQVNDAEGEGGDKSDE